jgi:dGTPase
MMLWNQLLNPARLGEKKQAAGAEISEDRNPYEMDYGRILFSNPFRRLHNKTQVFPMPENDHVHSRLTHSLEVANVGQTLGKMVGRRICRVKELHPWQPEHFGQIVATACLAHDIGNPPFGHHGEQAIGRFFQQLFKSPTWESVCSDQQKLDLTHFEGNAQGFRMLARLHMCRDAGGLRLTMASLGTFSKYPQSCLSRNDKARPGGKKFGFYHSEAELFQQVAEACGLLPIQAQPMAWHRHPLAYLMEAADDICYQILDLEDGVSLKLLSKEHFAQLLQPIIKDSISSWDVSRIRATAIGVLIHEVVDVFMDQEEALLQGKGHKVLMDLIPSAQHIQALNEVAVQTCYRASVVVKREVAATQVIGSLLEHLVASATKSHHPSLLPTLLGDRCPAASSHPYEQLQAIADFVCGMTDRYALSLYRQLNGMDLAMA